MARREGGNKRCFCPSVYLSVCPSVAYTANNSRTQRTSVPKSGMKLPHLRFDSHTSFKVKRSKVKVIRPINADTHHAAYLPNVNLQHTAGCCCLAYFSAISVSICTKLARSILMRGRDIVTEPNFWKSLSKSRIFFAEKQWLSIGDHIIHKRSNIRKKSSDK